MTPNDEQMDSAGKIYNEIFEAGGDVHLEVAKFLAARDARRSEMEAAREKIISAARTPCGCRGRGHDASCWIAIRLAALDAAGKGAA